MAKSGKKVKKPPRSSIAIPRIDAVPLPRRRRKSKSEPRPPAELPEPTATYHI